MFASHRRDRSRPTPPPVQVLVPPGNPSGNLALLEMLYEVIQSRRISVDDWNSAVAAARAPEPLEAAAGFEYLGWNFHAADLLHARLCIRGRPPAETGTIASTKVGSWTRQTSDRSPSPT